MSNVSDFDRESAQTALDAYALLIPGATSRYAETLATGLRAALAEIDRLTRGPVTDEERMSLAVKLAELNGDHITKSWTRDFYRGQIDALLTAGLRPLRPLRGPITDEMVEAAHAALPEWYRNTAIDLDDMRACLEAANVAEISGSQLPVTEEE